MFQKGFSSLCKMHSIYLWLMCKSALVILIMNRMTHAERAIDTLLIKLYIIAIYAINSYNNYINYNYELLQVRSFQKLKFRKCVKTYLEIHYKLKANPLLEFFVQVKNLTFLTISGSEPFPWKPHAQKGFWTRERRIQRMRYARERKVHVQKKRRKEHGTAGGRNEREDKDVRCFLSSYMRPETSPRFRYFFRKQCRTAPVG